MSTSEKVSHHHGDLHRALVDAGTQMLEAGEPFTLRAVARRVGVSQTAPYRHFPDREHLEAAIAARGFRALQTQLQLAVTMASDDGGEAGRDAAVAEPSNGATGDGTAASETPPFNRLGDVAVAYARYAIAHPNLYRLMFGQPCGELDERLQASGDVLAMIEGLAAQMFPAVDAHDLATAGWGLAHGLTSLHLDGKLVVTSPDEFETRIRGAVSALVAAAHTG